jgi:hypothetical protein
MDRSHGRQSRSERKSAELDLSGRLDFSIFNFQFSIPAGTAGRTREVFPSQSAYNSLEYVHS